MGLTYTALAGWPQWVSLPLAAWHPSTSGIRVGGRASVEAGIDLNGRIPERDARDRMAGFGRRVRARTLRALPSLSARSSGRRSRLACTRESGHLGSSPQDHPSICLGFHPDDSTKSYCARWTRQDRSRTDDSPIEILSSLWCVGRIRTVHRSQSTLPAYFDRVHGPRRSIFVATPTADVAARRPRHHNYRGTTLSRLSK